MKNRCGEVALVSGASSGIGSAVAKRLAEQGMRVYGAFRRGDWELPAQPVGKGFVQPLPMDVCDVHSVQTGVAQILAREPNGIDILVNCAGNGIAGAVEDTSDAEARFQMETNFFGTLNVCRVTLPGMRARGRGLVVNTASVAGFLPIPFQGMYSASKYAVIAASQALRMELQPFGVRVAVVAPGDTCTGFTAARKFCAASGEGSAYRERCRRSVADMERSEREGKSPDTVARAVVRLAGKKHPPMVTCVGAEYRFLHCIARLVPDRAMLWMMRKFYHC